MKWFSRGRPRAVARLVAAGLAASALAGCAALKGGPDDIAPTAPLADTCPTDAQVAGLRRRHRAAERPGQQEAVAQRDRRRLHRARQRQVQGLPGQAARAQRRHRPGHRPDRHGPDRGRRGGQQVGRQSRSRPRRPASSAPARRSTRRSSTRRRCPPSKSRWPPTAPPSTRTSSTSEQGDETAIHARRGAIRRSADMPAGRHHRGRHFGHHPDRAADKAAETAATSALFTFAFAPTIAPSTCAPGSGRG